MYYLGEEMPFDYSLVLFLFFAAPLALLMFLLGRLVYRSLKGRRLEKARVEYKAQKGPSGEGEGKVVVEASPEAVRAVLIQRIEGIKNKNPRVIASLVDRKRYSKFDDWPPFKRQGSEALKREADALKVLEEYEYETSDWKIDIFGDAALASFTIKYRGKIRELRFNVRSRVSAFLLRREGSWKLVHEHWSRFPEQA